MDRLEEFLKELAELSKKHGLFIGGCGCCGSPCPWIYDTKENICADNLGYDEKKEIYTVC